MTDARRDAGEGGDIAYFERVRARGGDLDERDEHGQTAIYVAAHSGRLDLVRWLVAAGASLEAHDPDCEVKYYYKNMRPELRGTRWTLLHGAAMCASMDVVAYLLDEHGYAIDVRDLGGWTPLHVVAFYPFASVEAIDALVARGADVNAPNANGENVLCMARDAAIARHLLALGARADGGDHVAAVAGALVGANPERPIDRFALAGDVAMVEDLIAAGAKPTANTLETAVFRRDATLVEKLLPHLGPEEIASSLSRVDDPALFERLVAASPQLPPGIVADAAGLPWKLSAVIAAGAPVDEPNAEGWTALHLAARAGLTDAAGVLLEHRASTAVKLPDGKTPLHVAAEHGKLELVRLLVEAGADASATMKGGKTPRALAYGTHDEVARFLEPHTRVAAPPPPVAAPLAVGSSVQHVKFGVGTVVAREGDKLRVKFADAERVLVARVLTPAT